MVMEFIFEMDLRTIHFHGMALLVPRPAVVAVIKEDGTIFSIFKAGFSTAFKTGHIHLTQGEISQFKGIYFITEDGELELVSPKLKMAEAAELLKQNFDFEFGA